jgi:hypothetical protein
MFFLLAALALTPGCFHRTKNSGAIATQTEEELKQRWVAKRMSELQAGGVADPREARRQAVEEFRKKYEYAGVAQAPDRVGGGTP